MPEVIDIKLDPKTGRVFINEVTHDAVIIKGEDVILQDAAIKLRTQIGTVQRVGLDDFGWDYLSRLKRKINDETLSFAINKVKKLILQDSRIDDADVAVAQSVDFEELLIKADIRIGKVFYSLYVTL